MKRTFSKWGRSYTWLHERSAIRRKIVIAIALLTIIACSLTVAHAQEKNERTLSPEQLEELVRRFHPVAKQADIFIEQAKADITIARAAFDPFLGYTVAQKTFDGVTYYYNTQPGITIPTWFGIEIQTGIEYLSGSRTDPQDTKGATSFAGVSIPVARNLLMDKRRAVLQSAKITRESSEAEKRKTINNLLLDAIKTYWDWVKHYRLYTIIDNAVKVNEQRLALIKTAVSLGDRPSIDTVEALTQLQYFQLQRTEALMNYQNKILELSLFLWTEDQQPYQIPVDVVPPASIINRDIFSMSIPAIEELLAIAEANHPELQLYKFKLDILSIEKKLKFQELLPIVNLKYQQLGKGYDIAKTSTGPFLRDNYQYGISVGIPLRFSSGRGEYRKAGLKITETRLQEKQKRLEIANKVRSYYNELLAVLEQAGIQKNAYRNYLALQRGEENRFRGGESSLFLVNSREIRALEALGKLASLEIEFFQLLASLRWASATLI